MAKCQFFNKVFGQCAALLPTIPCSAFDCRTAAGDCRNYGAPSHPAQGNRFRLTISAKTFIFKELSAPAAFRRGAPIRFCLFYI